jgi:hypothetical protein
VLTLLGSPDQPFGGQGFLFVGHAMARMSPGLIEDSGSFSDGMDRAALHRHISEPALPGSTIDAYDGRTKGGGGVGTYLNALGASRRRPETVLRPRPPPR